MHAGDVASSFSGKQRLHDCALAALRAGVRLSLRQHAAHLPQRPLQPLGLLAGLGCLFAGTFSLLPAADIREHLRHVLSTAEGLRCVLFLLTELCQ